MQRRPDAIRIHAFGASQVNIIELIPILYTIAIANPLRADLGGYRSRGVLLSSLVRPTSAWTVHRGAASDLRDSHINIPGLHISPRGNSRVY